MPQTTLVTEATPGNPQPAGITANPLVVTVGGAADVVASGTISTQNLNPLTGVATPLSTVEVSLLGADTLGVQVTGAGTGVLSVQGTLDGTNWVTLGGSQVQRISDGSLSATIPSATPGIFLIGVGGFLKARVTALAAVTSSYVVSVRAVDGNTLVALDGAIPAGTATIGTVLLGAGAAIVGAITGATGAVAGILALLVNSTASNNLTSVKASPGSLFELSIFNGSVTAAFVKLYNKASAPVVASDVPIAVIPVAAAGFASYSFGENGKRFTTGIALAIVGLAADTDATNVAAGIKVSGTYV